MLVAPASASAAVSAVKEYARCGATTAAVRFMEFVHVNTDCDCEEFLGEEFKVQVEGLGTPVASGVGDALAAPVSEPEAAAGADWDGDVLVGPASASEAISAVKEFVRCGASTAAVRFRGTWHVNTDKEVVCDLMVEIIATWKRGFESVQHIVKLLG